MRNRAVSTISLLCAIAALLTFIVFTRSNDAQPNTITHRGDDPTCLIATDAVDEAQDNLDEAIDKLDDIDSQLDELAMQFSNTEDDSDFDELEKKETELLRDERDAERELVTAQTDYNKASSALDTCLADFAAQCAESQPERDLLMTQIETLEGEIDELTSQVRAGNSDARTVRSDKRDELTEARARLRELQDETANCVAAETPVAEDDGTGDPAGESLWAKVCGTANPADAETGLPDIFWWHNHQDVLDANYNGPKDETLDMAGATPAESKANMNFRRCWDPALVVEHLVNAGEVGVPEFGDWKGLDTAAMRRASVYFGNHPEAWARGINALRSVEDNLVATFGERDSAVDKIDMFYMVDGVHGIPDIVRGDDVFGAEGVPAQKLPTLQFVDPRSGYIWLEYSRICGFQPLWPKDRPTPPKFPGTPPENPTTTTTPTTPTTNPPTSTTTPPVKCFDAQGQPVYIGSFCGTPDSGPDQQPVDDNDPDAVAPTPGAPIIPPPPPPSDNPTDEEEAAVGGDNPVADEIKDDPDAPAAPPSGPPPPPAP